MDSKNMMLRCSICGKRKEPDHIFFLGDGNLCDTCAERVIFRAWEFQYLREIRKELIQIFNVRIQKESEVSRV